MTQEIASPRGFDHCRAATELVPGVVTVPLLFLAVIAVALAACASPAPGDASAAPYAALRQAYAAQDARAAAAAYHPDALFEEDYPGQPKMTRRGREDIAAGFAAIFTALKPAPGEAQLDLNFRITARRVIDGATEDEGYFRLRHGPGEGAKRPTLYGRFETRHARSAFLFDRSTPAERASFEAAPGPVLLAADEELLAPEFYDALLGVYRGADGQKLRVTRSQRSLFAFDEADLTWRALNRDSGLRWRAGARLRDPEGASAHYVFAADGASLTRATPGAEPVLFKRELAIARRPIRFKSGELTLAGTILFAPEISAARPGIVLAHGSGPQDRHGYASLIEFLAIEFVEAGYVVLTYDKRGVGASQGDWTSANFAALAEDAHAAMTALRAEAGVDARRVGLGGSSQAGWVAAKAIARGAAPDFVFLLGAAGAAMTVAEQNLYNTRVQMQCAGLSAPRIERALEQQKAFFAARADHAARPALTQATLRAQADEAIRPWLFPGDPTPAAAPQWYDVLETDFDPLPIWARYRGAALFLFGARDPSTDSQLAMERLAALPASPRRLAVAVPDTEHLGLTATTACADMTTLGGFSPPMLQHIRQWARMQAQR